MKENSRQTNALIQRKGGKVAVITTRGFRDLLEIGRQTRPHLYSFQIDHAAPLVPRHLRFEVDERITAGRIVITPLDERSLAHAVDDVRETGANSCAVCLLFSFMDDHHERCVGEALTKAGGDQLMVSLSSEVQPEFREYERFSTTVLNAYLQPIMGEYLTYLEKQLSKQTATAKVGINQSSGGLMSVETARRLPIRTALSGPAAGAVGAIHTARNSRQPDIITLDMGGTSADVALIRNYEAGTASTDGSRVSRCGCRWSTSTRRRRRRIDRLVRPRRADEGRPQSAGAQPGPACYGKGGTDATVTDANLVLGRLSPQAA